MTQGTPVGWNTGALLRYIDVVEDSYLAVDLLLQILHKVSASGVAAILSSRLRDVIVYHVRHAFAHVMV